MMTFPTEWKNKKCSKPPTRGCNRLYHLVFTVNDHEIWNLPFNMNCHSFEIFSLWSVRFDLFHVSISCLEESEYVCKSGIHYIPKLVPFSKNDDLQLVNKHFAIENGRKWQLIYRTQGWWFSSSPCKRLPEGNNQRVTTIYKTFLTIYSPFVTIQ